MCSLRNWTILQAVWSLLILTVGGCGSSSELNQTNRSVKSPNTAPADRSLTTDEYLRLGMPAADREWTGQDMTKVAELMASLEKEKRHALPRRESQRSGKVFSRLVSSQNLEIYRNHSLPIQSRISQAMLYFGSSKEIFKLYLSASLANEVGSIEIVDLFGVVLQNTVLLLELTDEFLPTLDKNDSSYPVRVQGLEGIKRGLASIVTGCIATLTERSSYSRDDLANLLRSMRETFPQIVPRLLPDTRTEVLLELDRLQRDPKLEDLQTQTRDLNEAVKAALEHEKLK